VPPDLRGCEFGMSENLLKQIMQSLAKNI